MPAIYPPPVVDGYGWWWITATGEPAPTPAPAEVVPEQDGYTVIIYFAGETITVRPYRDPITSRLQVWGEGDTTRSITVRAPWPVDVPALLLEGHRLRGTRAVVYSPRGDRVLDGQIVSGRYWRVGADVEVTIDQYSESTALFPDMFSSSLRVVDQDATDALQSAVRDSLTTDSYIIPPQFAVDQTTTAGKILATLDARATRPIAPMVSLDGIDDLTVWTEERIGRVYQFVFGQPGADIDGRGAYRGAPAIPLKNAPAGSETIMVAGHPVSAATCIVHGPDGRGGYYSQALAISQQTDNVGRKISIVDLSGANRHVPDPAADQPPVHDGFDLDNFSGTWWEEEWFVSWTSESTPGLLGEVAMRMLRASGRTIDWARMEAQRQRLNTYRIDGYIDEQVDPIQWLEEATEVMPASLVNGPSGLYLWCWDPEADALWTLSEAPGLCAVYGDIEAVGERPINNYRLRYALLDSSDDYIRSAAVQTARTTVSLLQNGLSEIVRESDIIVRDAVAERVAAEYLEFHAEAPLRFTCDLLEAEYRDVYAGDTVRIDMRALGMDGYGVIEAVEWDGGPVLTVDVLYMPGWRK